MDGLNERRRRLFGDEGIGGAQPVARIEYVNRPLQDPITGEDAVVLIMDDHLEVSSLYSPDEQQEGISRALDHLLSSS